MEAPKLRFFNYNTKLFVVFGKQYRLNEEYLQNYTQVNEYPWMIVFANETQVGGCGATLHYVHFVKYDDAVSFYDAVSDTIRRRGGNRGIFTEEGVDTVAYFGGNHGSRV